MRGPGLRGAILSTPWEACDVAKTVPTQGDLLMTNLALASIIHKEHLGTRSKHTLPPPLPLKTFVKFALAQSGPGHRQEATLNWPNSKQGPGTIRAAEEGGSKTPAHPCFPQIFQGPASLILPPP